MAKKKYTYEQLVAECRRMRARSERAEAEYFVFLMTAERAHEAVWREAGCETFEQFLMSNHLCELGRYRMFAIGVDKVGVDKALEFGVAWTCAAARMQNVSREGMADFERRASSFVETERVAPSQQTVREWRKEIEQPGKDPLSTRRASELSRLRAENSKLRAELAAAKKRISDLEQQLGRRTKGRKAA